MAPAPTTKMWKSKLGTAYPKEQIDRLDAEHHRILKGLRGLPENKRCADCGAPETNWASVNLGVFLCTRCASVHRGLGTHVSKTKSCMGTYLWGPDEIARMREMGNGRGVRVYLGRAGAKDLPPRSAALGPDGIGDAALREFAVKKYEQRLWAVSEEEADEEPEKKESGVAAEGQGLILVRTTQTKTPSSSPGASPAAAAKTAILPAPGSSTSRQPEKPTEDFLDDFFDGLLKDDEQGLAPKKEPVRGTSEDFSCGLPEPAAWIQTTSPPVAGGEMKNPFRSEQKEAFCGEDLFFCDWGAPAAPRTPCAPKEAEQQTGLIKQTGLFKQQTGLIEQQTGLFKGLAPQKAAQEEIDWFEGW